MGVWDLVQGFLDCVSCPDGQVWVFFLNCLLQGLRIVTLLFKPRQWYEREAGQEGEQWGQKKTRFLLPFHAYDQVQWPWVSGAPVLGLLCQYLTRAVIMPAIQP